MPNPPAFQLYASDFYMDTITWTTEEVGAYFRLLLIEWINGPLPNDPRELAKICGFQDKNWKRKWGSISQKVLKKFSNCSQESLKKFSNLSQESVGCLLNLRLESTRQEQYEYRKKLAESGSLGGKKTQEKKSEKLKQGLSEASRLAKALQSSVFNNKEIIKKAEKLLEIYPGNGNRKAAVKSILKIFCDPPKELLPCPYSGLKNRIERYIHEVKIKKTGKDFIIKSHNFFGKDERWKDDRPEEKLTVW